MYEKLTCIGNKCNSYLYFSFDARKFDTDKVTNELKIEPTSVMIKKNPAPKSTSWKYGIDGGNEIDLQKLLDQLINVFEPKIEDINRVKEKFKLSTRVQFVIDIDINPESSTPFFGLNKRTIDFLYKTGTGVDYDLYKVDVFGLLNN